MRALRLVLLLLVLPMATVGVVARAATPPPPFVIVVNSANPTSGVSRRFLADAFLKKATRWDDGEVIRPADQLPDSAVRRRFSEDVLKRSVSAVRNYWQQAVFSGRDVPPPELDSDEEVVKFVLKYPGAVGYVSGGANIDGVKGLSVY